MPSQRQGFSSITAHAKQNQVITFYQFWRGDIDENQKHEFPISTAKPLDFVTTNICGDKFDDILSPQMLALMYHI